MQLIYIFVGMALLVLSIISPSYAQVFQGQVIDADSEEPIALASIFLPDLQTGTVTDENGIFSLKKLPKNNIRFQISSIGYKTLEAQVNIYEANNTFRLQPIHLDLQELVIAVPGGKLQGENVVNVERKSLKEIEHSANFNPSQMISSMGGVGSISTGTGIGKPVIRGLTGNRIVTYAQGIRVENQQWGEEHGLGVGSLGIEAVEVIKGPASMIYGSDALAGVLYFVDERYADQNTTEGYVSATGWGNTLGYRGEAGFKLNKQNFKWNLFGGYSSHSDYKLPSGERVLNSRFDEVNLKTAFGYNTKSWITNLRYSFLKNHFGIVEEFETTEDAARNLLPSYQSIDNHSLSWENTLLLGESKLNLILGFTGNNRLEFEEETKPALDMELNSYTYNLKWFTPQITDHLNLIIGSQGMYQTNHNHGEEVLIPDAVTMDGGIFTLLNYQREKLKVQTGIRYDLRKINTEEYEGGNHGHGQGHDEKQHFEPLNRTFQRFNFLAGATFQQNQFSFRANVSTGYRSPNTSELLSHGVHHGASRFEVGNPGLLSERSLQVDMSVEYASDHVELAINPFINFVNNFIFLSPTDSIEDGVPVFEYQQTQAKLYGGEAGLHFHPHSVHWLHFETNLSIVFGMDRENNALPLIPAHRLQSKVSADLPEKERVHFNQLFIEHVYALEQNRTGYFEDASGKYHLLNAGLQLAVPFKTLPLTINAGVNNLLNTSYIPHLSRFKEMGIPHPGRNVFVSIKMKFKRNLE